MSQDNQQGQLLALEEDNEQMKNNDQQQGFCNKVLLMLDIFRFLPVPKTQPVSTKKSLIGSIVILGIFLAYVLYTLITFIISNYPKMTTYVSPLPNDLIVPAPKMAIQFLWGNDLNQLYPNQSLFINIQFQQVIKTKEGQQIKTTYPLSNDNCGSLDWIGFPYNNSQQYNLLCPPNNTQLNMQGLLLTSPQQQYPQFVFTYCNFQQNPLCFDNGNITAFYQFTSGGRIFLFIQTQNKKNYITGQTISNTYNFIMKYFFLVPGLYNRAELVMQVDQFKINPDYLTSFSQENLQNLNLLNENNYVSNVSIFNNLSAYQIWMRLDQNIQNIDVVYPTIIDQVSMWGALWGVLFALFAFYFLRFNKQKFYKSNPKWDQFDKEINNISKKKLDQIESN